MEIQSLKLVVTEADANQLVAEMEREEREVENLRIAFTPAGVVVSGSTKALLFSVSFETLWEITLLEGRVVARLMSLKVAGIPAGKMRGMILKVLRDAVAKQPGVTVLEDQIHVDVNEVAKSRRFPLQIDLKTITVASGTITIDA